MENGHPVEPSAAPAPPSNRPAIWVWPVIVLSIAGIILSPQWLPEAEKVTEIEDYAAGLVTLQMQARMIVAVDSLDSAQARSELRKLESAAASNGTAAALAILHVFIDPDGNGPGEATRLLEDRMNVEGANVEVLEKIQRVLADGATESERESLQKHLGGFVEYLPAPGEPLTWPNGEEIRSRSMTTLKIIGSAALGGLLAGMAGCLLLMIGGYRLMNGTLNAGTPAVREGAGAFLVEGFAIFMGFLFAAQIAGFALHWSFQVIFMVIGVVATLIWPCWRGGFTWREVRTSMGLHRGKGWIREIGAGVAGYLAVVPLAGAGLILTMILSLIVQATGDAPVETPSHPIVGLLGSGWVTLITVFVFGSVIAPLTEEITFRGAFFGGLRSRWRFLASGLITGLIFAVIHPQGFLAIPPLAAIGFGLAGIREWRGSLIAPMVTHGISNGLVFTLAILVLG